jgi:hypothetical protein
MARGGNPKLIRTDVDCRAARPKFNEAAWSSAKISDVTSDCLYLFAKPDESRSGDAPSKLWRYAWWLERLAPEAVGRNYSRRKIAPPVVRAPERRGERDTGLSCRKGACDHRFHIDRQQASRRRSDLPVWRWGFLAAQMFRIRYEAELLLAFLKHSIGDGHR